jgi:hypothetical protein
MARMLRSRGAATAIAAWLVLGAQAHADPLDDARVAVEASEYLKARGAIAEALASGALGRDELAEIHRLSGVVAGALGDPKAATAAFQRALALSPKLTLPPGTSPKIVRPFTAAQGLAKQSAALEIRSETAADPPAVTVIVVADPLSMIQRVRVTVVADGKPEQTIERPIERPIERRIEDPAAERTAVELPPAARLDVRIAALDEHGNRLAELGSREVPIVIVGKAPPPRRVAIVRPPRSPGPPRSPRPRHLQWWAWGGAAAVFGVAATCFGIDAVLAKGDLDDLNRESIEHSFDEAKDAEGRARRDVLLANIGYGAAGALAIGAAILYFTEPRPARGERRVTVAPMRGGGALVLGGSF